jgi:hypothetical protein
MDELDIDGCPFGMVRVYIVYSIRVMTRNSKTWIVISRQARLPSPLPRRWP